MVVGPPGTGKTDTAVQAELASIQFQAKHVGGDLCAASCGPTEVVNLLFHNFPDQKIVLVAHSNQALNDLFEKIVALDIPERYLLRLGRGIEALGVQKMLEAIASRSLDNSVPAISGAGCEARLLQVGSSQSHVDVASALLGGPELSRMSGEWLDGGNPEKP